MQRDGRSWDQTVSLGGRGVSCVWAEVHAVCFCWIGLTGPWTGLTGGYVGRSMQTSLTGGVEAEPVELV